jgi:hypothetical protein
MTLETQPKAGMSSEPKLYYKCITNKRQLFTNKWWTVGKLYPLVNGDIIDDDDYPWRALTVESGRADADFTPVWLLPDGTELEALE